MRTNEEKLEAVRAVIARWKHELEHIGDREPHEQFDQDRDDREAVEATCLHNGISELEEAIE